MSLTGNNGLLAAAGANQPAHSIERSVVLDTNSYFTRTPSSAGNRKTYTLSFWAKLSQGSNGIGFGQYSDSSNRVYFRVQPAGFSVYSVSGGSADCDVSGSFVFRDPSAWYHIVIVVDTTESTASNRIKLWVNGSSKTLTHTTSWTQNTDTRINDTNEHTLGLYNNTAYPDGYLAEVNFIDGTALTPASFGETNEDTNQWQAINYTGSYGTNGFYLDFATRATDPIDASGNGNNWGSVNVLAGDWKIDSPTNNFATLNPLMTTGTNYTYSEGNLKYSTASFRNGATTNNIAMTSGKWYWEIVMTTNGSTAATHLGVVGMGAGINHLDSYSPRSVYQPGSGNLYQSGSSTTALTSSAVGDIIGFALDVDSNELSIYKNNSSILSGHSLPTNSDGGWLVQLLGEGLGNIMAGVVNFGQDSSFAGEKTAQGNGGVGEDFYYTPPTGYKALNTDNLDDPSIDDPTKHFNTKLWTSTSADGTSALGAVTGVGFQPDLVWAKGRTAAWDHSLFNSVMGTGLGKALYTDVTFEAGAYDTSAYGNVTSFDSDGFTVGLTAGNNYAYNYGSGTKYLAWNWKARGGTAPSKTYAVTVTNPGSGNRYTLDTRVSGTNAIPITLEEGGTYTFDQADNSNSGHPLRFSTTSNGTHGGGSEYTTGVTTNGTPGSAGAYTRITVAASAPTLYYYCTAHSGMGAEITTPGVGGGVSNLGGTIASVTNANTTAGFSIVSWTASGTNNDTVGHGLSVVPELIIVKSIDGARAAAREWYIYTQKIDGSLDFLNFNTNAKQDSSANVPTSSVFSVIGSVINTSGENIIGYCFHSVDGYSKVGKYTGNGLADGAFVYTGFRPAFIMFKRTDSASNWTMFDNKTDPQNSVGREIYADLANAEAAHYNALDFVSNGFKLRSVTYAINASSGSFIYLAFAESPFKYANAR